MVYKLHHSVNQYPHLTASLEVTYLIFKLLHNTGEICVVKESEGVTVLV